MRKKNILILLLFLASFGKATGCTTFLVSGKYTPDGRPLLFKQRDTGELVNKIEILTTGKYRCVGIINSNDKTNREIYGGYNEAGFAIINSASYNLNSPEEASETENDGLVMRIALQTCTSLSDFEHLLDTLARPTRISSNFGVIDARGGAAYYETGNHGFTKFDANDKNVAPLGYLVRTNFSFSGRREDDKGLARFNAASELLLGAAQSGTTTDQFFLKKLSRCLKHGITGENLEERMPRDNESPVFVSFRDYIPRTITASVLLIQGIRPQESPRLTTMWTILGFPFTTPAIPIWLTGENDLPAIVRAGSDGKVPLCNWSLRLKEKLFPISRGEGGDYLNLAALKNEKKEGIYQQIEPAEQEIRGKASPLLQQWRQTGIRPDDVKSFYQWIDQYLGELYSNRWNIQ